MPARHYEWLFQAAPASPGHTPVYRSKRLAPDQLAGAAAAAQQAAVPPLCSSFRGSATLRQVFLAAVEEHGDRPLLGSRAAGPDGALRGGGAPRQRGLGRHPAAHLLLPTSCWRNAGSAGDYVWQSYRQVHQQVQPLAGAMARAGAGRGARVGVYGVNSPEWATVSRHWQAGRQDRQGASRCDAGCHLLPNIWLALCARRRR
jgi:hypothetical protein